MDIENAAERVLAERRERLARRVGETLQLPDRGAPAAPSEATRRHLLEEARELYWNELEWENLMDEEDVEAGAGGAGDKVTELAFPGFLAFTRGLLLTEAPEDALAEHEPRPEVVEEILQFLAARVVELEDPQEEEETRGDRERREAERAMTLNLVDLVLVQLYDVSPAEMDEDTGFDDA